MDAPAARLRDAREGREMLGLGGDDSARPDDIHAYSRILVAVDGSHVSDRALEAALRLARDQHAQVRLVHVVDTVRREISAYPVPDLEAYRRTTLRAGRQILDEAVTRAHAAGVDAGAALAEVDSAHPSVGILREALGWSADLLVLGTHGHGGLLHRIRGGVAEAVIADASVPVLLVRADGSTTGHGSG